MRIIKKCVSLVIVVLLFLYFTNNLNVYAMENPTIISEDTIENLSTVNNIDVQLAEFAVKNTAKDYVATITPDTPDSIRAAKINAIIKANESYNQLVKAQSANAKNAYMTYFNMKLQNELLQIDIEIALNNKAMATEKLKRNFISKDQYNTILKEYENLVKQGIKQETRVADSLDSFLEMVNVKDNYLIENPKMMEFSAIEKINVENDLAVAIDKDNDITNLKKALDFAKGVMPVSTDDVNEAELKLEQAQKKFANEFRTTYKNLKALVNDYLDTEKTLSETIQTTVKWEKKYKMGYISKKQLNVFYSGILKSQIQLKSDNYNIHSQKTAYDNLVNGY